MVTTDLRGITGKSGTTGDDVIMQPGITSRIPPIPSS
jgi:hypothetical protein